MNLPDVERSFVSIRSAIDGGSLRVTFTGTADLRIQSALEDFLAALHRETTACSVLEVHVDVRAVEFMSSACFREIVGWVCQVDESSSRYRISFHCNPRQQWQRRSMRALSSFAGDFVSVVNTSAQGHA
jgi:hypothetical protein